MLVMFDFFSSGCDTRTMLVMFGVSAASAIPGPRLLCLMFQQRVRYQGHACYVWCFSSGCDTRAMLVMFGVSAAGAIPVPCLLCLVFQQLVRYEGHACYV